jgi:hypothetical protein
VNLAEAGQRFRALLEPLELRALVDAFGPYGSTARRGTAWVSNSASGRAGR